MNILEYAKLEKARLIPNESVNGFWYVLGLKIEYENAEIYLTYYLNKEYVIKSFDDYIDYLFLWKQSLLLNELPKINEQYREQFERIYKKFVSMISYYQIKDAIQFINDNYVQICSDRAIAVATVLFIKDKINAKWERLYKIEVDGSAGYEAYTGEPWTYIPVPYENRTYTGTYGQVITIRNALERGYYFTWREERDGQVYYYDVGFNAGADYKYTVKGNAKLIAQKRETTLQESGDIYTVNQLKQLQNYSFSDNDNIPEFFDGEQNDLIVAILNRELKKCGDNPKTRKYELLSSIVDRNSYIGNKQRMFVRIKEIFSDGETMSAAERSELEKMGFEITEDGKHYKLKFMGGDKYWYTVSKTPSDNRGGKNEATKIINGLSVYK